MVHVSCLVRRRLQLSPRVQRLAVLLRLGLQGIQTFNVQAVGQRLTARIRNDLFAHAMALSLRFHDRTPVGKLLTRLTSDVDALAEVFGSGAVGILADLVTLLVIAATMIAIEPRLGLLLLATQVPVTLTMLWLQRRYRKANYRVREELSQLNADLQENLQGLEVVQMFRREATNSARFSRVTTAYREAVTGTILYDSAISAFIEWVALSAVAVVLALGGWMVTAGVMGLGTLTTFILYSQRLFDPLRQLAERFTQIQGGLTAVERIGELLEEPIEIMELPLEQRSAGAVASGGERSSAGEVIFEKVSFAYREDDPILTDLSFRIAPGEHVALVGPTGSGKTLSLYACLDVLNQSHVNIASIEDPCEMVVPGINQVNVNERAGLDFATGLRAFLRQDPDVLMVGEIRDRTTAGIALQAAQTGHLVLTTLHTNDAPGVLYRLMHMGVEAFQLAASVHLVTAQRLVRRLCPQCKQPSTLGAEFERLGLGPAALTQSGFTSPPRPNQAVYKPLGCGQCLEGFMGRVGIFQVMPVSPAMASLLVQEKDLSTLTAQAQREGMRTLRQAGWLKVSSGLTAVQEVLGATHV